MVNTLVCSCLFRVVLPLVLLTAVVVRFNVLSFIYLLLLLVAPLVPGPTPTSSGSGHTGRYLKAVLGLSIISCLAHVVFQIVLLSLGDYGTFPVQCTQDGRLLALVGLHRLDSIQPLDALRLMGLDFILLLTTVGVLVTCGKVSEESDEKEKVSIKRKRKYSSEVMIVGGEFLFLIYLAGAGILHPSLMSSIYFLLFLTLSTWLASSRKLGHMFVLGRTILAVYCAIHFIILYLYQFDYAQKLIHPSSQEARLLGFVGLVDSTCRKDQDSRSIIYHSEHWTVYIQPLLVLGLYCIICFLTRYRLSSHVIEEIPNDSEHAVTRDDSNKSSPASLLRRRKSNTKEGSQGLLEDDEEGQTFSVDPSHPKDSLAIDLNGSIIFSTDGDIIDGSNASDEDASGDGKKQLFFSSLVCLFHLMKKGSYVATLIVMMTWSITYHSWLTFVLLLWSCVVWMLPNSRQACLYSSPFFVAYAEALLLLQYIYGLNLNDSELPEKNETVNLEQIGLTKYYDLSYQPLAIKILYTIVFWIALHQYVVEKRLESNRDISEKLVMETYNISYSDTHPEDSKPAAYHRRLSAASFKGESPFLCCLGVTVKKLLVKYWIFIVTCMLMVISLGGEKVVIYRIVYLFLCLFFILVFQFSYNLWRKVMYGFWITVIVYSMLVLISIYTYQFENFENYWMNFLGIPLHYQKEIGLEKYMENPATLFLTLLIPTFFLVITILQVHYFHKDFLHISGFNYREEKHGPAVSQTETIVLPDADTTQVIIDEAETDEYATVSAGTSSPATSFGTTKRDNDWKGVDEDKSVVEHVEKQSQDVKTLKRWLHVTYVKTMGIWQDISNLIWQFLEIHVIKIVLFSVFFLAVYEVSAFHLVFVIFVIVALPFQTLQTFLSHCCAVWASILLLTKMIYQLEFLNQFDWKVNCSVVNDYGQNSSEFPSPFSETIDNRVWIGLRKTSSLLVYCKGYIGVIFVLSLQAVVKIRQKLHRYHRNEDEPQEKVMFPGVTRVQADEGLLECIKFLSNYIFYKFGIEFCLVAIVVCIAVRLDVYAVVSALWLCGLFLLRRRVISRVWPFYICYQCIILPIQYIKCVGIPLDCVQSILGVPVLASVKNCENGFISLILQHHLIRTRFLWTFSNFCLLAQLRVFTVEMSLHAEETGGSNSEIWFLKDLKTIINPIPDFVTYTKSYLDMVKVWVFFSFYWITLAVMFLAGTSRVSLFAMGYVIGCFLFLWSGNEFYLKPIKTLLRMWNCLLAYNVLVILLKSILQVFSCVFLSTLYKNFCWLVQLLGIVCTKKLSDQSKADIDNFILEGECSPPTDQAGMMWDGICFGILLLQKRIFCSFYFQHMVTEIEFQQVLASRGARLIYGNKIREVCKQQDVEQEIMEKIKEKMTKIKAQSNQQKEKKEYKEPESHFQAIRSGDYYMLDDIPDKDIDLELSPSKKYDDDDEEEQEAEEKGVNALLTQALKSQSECDLEEHQKGDVDQQSIDRSPGLSQPQQTSQQVFLSPNEVPGTSCQSPLDAKSFSTAQQSIKEDEAEIPAESSVLEKIQGCVEFGAAIFLSILISATAKLNSISKEYRYVAQELSLKKYSLKKERYKNQHSETLEGMKTLEVKDPSMLGISKETSSVHLWMSSKDLSESAGYNSSPDALDKDFEKSQPTAVRFLRACYYAAVSHSDILCYLMIVVNQIESASLLSLPLPFMAFLWGALSVPRPSKSFWITVITYTEAIVVVKYLFQFDFFPWNVETHVNDPFWPPRILGIEKKSNYAVYDLALLLVVFFHRFVLKSLGLWKDGEDKTLSKEILDGNPGISSEERMTGRTESEKDWLLSQTQSQKDIHGESTEGNVFETGESQVSEAQIAPFIQYGDEEKPDAQEVGIGNRKTPSNTYKRPFVKFFMNLLYSKYRVTADVYAIMFFCDFVNMLVVVFGYWAFGTDTADGGVASYVEENKIPIPFLIMLVAQFALIIIDRALYLRKNVLGKLIFQIILVFIIHIWMFFILPAVTEREFTSPTRLPPKLWYFVKCVYLLISAYQLRSGYPTRILGVVFCKNYNYINYFLFKGYMMIPFLYEIRSLMDWIFTDTSLNFGNWFKMEDIFTNIYLLKCIRRVEAEYPTPRGAKRAAHIKYGVGGVLLFIIILIIWFPLLLFALGNMVRLSNSPYDCTVEITVEGYEPIFKMSAQRSSLNSFTQSEWNKMLHYYRLDPSAQSFLDNYDMQDVMMVKMNGNSTSVWTISPPSQTALINELLSNETELNVKLSWSFSRQFKTSDVEKSVHNEHFIILNNLEDRELRVELAQMLNGSSNVSEITLPYLFPKYLRVPGRGQPSPVKDLVRRKEKHLDVEQQLFRNLSLHLRYGSLDNFNAESEWWEIQEECNNSNFPYPFYSSKDCNYLHLIAFNDKVFPSELSALSGYGIVGLYTTFVLVVSKILRGALTGTSFKIMYTDMPFVDRVLQLCLDIYLVRENGELSLEEDLYAKLLFLYRSPEKLIAWTRYP
ncbi:LOW QUALITY PROTEIN: piezo-type mechanosensitive ion channel component 2-like [Tachypleus tridentatus]|uniref:LOW QUALITY PROTEIN: piezo-type mechanosensitive ion channel component 2-like n=1 Tax=Tachypleus tridentatus TaxID=6853 RepID=UPI003FCFA842